MSKPKKQAEFRLKKVIYQLKVPSNQDQLKMICEFMNQLGQIGFKGEVVGDDILIDLEVFVDESISGWKFDLEQKINKVLAKFDLDTPWGQKQREINESYRNWCVEKGSFP